MANIKITDLTAYGNPTSTDVLPIVDVGADVTKKVSIADLLENAGSGTAAAPGIAFDGDPDTGIYRPGANQLALSTNGTGKLFIDSAGKVTVKGVGTAAFVVEGTAPDNSLVVKGSTGNVGIGTSAPSSRLHVSDSSAAMIRTNRTTDEKNHIALGTQDTIRGYIGATSNNCFEVSDSGGASKVTITNSGNVGIGTTSPQQPLHIKNAVSSACRLVLENTGSSSPTSTQVWSQDNDLVFDANGGEAVRIDSARRLLVGTSSDSGGALLQVNGDRIRVATAKTPASASDTGTAGEICWDASYIYVCTATNTWKRAALSTW